VFIVVRALPEDFVVNDVITAKVALAQGCEVFLLESSDDPRDRVMELMASLMLRETAGFGSTDILDFNKTQSAAHNNLMFQCLGCKARIL
jgi:hypothetical protein